MMDLDFGATTPVRPGTSTTDFDPLAASSSHASKPKASSGDMPDFDLGLGDFDAKAAPAAMDMALDKAAPTASAASDLDFDFTPATPSKAAEVDMPLDLTALSLDLGAPVATTTAAVAGAASPTASAAICAKIAWRCSGSKRPPSERRSSCRRRFRLTSTCHSSRPDRPDRCTWRASAAGRSPRVERCAGRALVRRYCPIATPRHWVPACAGMTPVGRCCAGLENGFPLSRE